jgi:hypothetical protein
VVLLGTAGGVTEKAAAAVFAEGCAGAACAGFPWAARPFTEELPLWEAGGWAG